MITILDKHNCCGCAACVQVCPKQCISFNEDEQGFRYPLVDKDTCIDCGLCEKVCPVINQAIPKKPLKVYAAINPNEEIRMKSSSGGIFTMLAENVINAGGVVFGARFDDNWEVKHGYTETIEGLEAFRGSKYVQSCVGETYNQAREFLKSGRKVLYTGTSCQIAGLKKFLRKEYDILITVDVVCHGVPSPLVWRTYLNEFIKRPKGVVGENSVDLSLKEAPEITGISFRDKSTGWGKFGFVIRKESAFKADKNTVLSSVNTLNNGDVFLHETLNVNLYLQVFLKNLCLRPSCSQCPAKSGKCESDFSLADYWGIGKYYPDLDDNKGTSLILVNTKMGSDLLEKIGILKVSTTYEQALSGNLCIEHSVDENCYIESFWHEFYKTGLSNISWIMDKFKPSLLHRIACRIKRIIIK